MKRPLAVIGFSFLFTLAAASYLSVAAAAALSAFLAVCAAIAFFCRAYLPHRAATILVLLTAAAALAAFCVAGRLHVAPVEKYNGIQAEIEGTVTDLPTRSGTVEYTILHVRSITVDGEKSRVNTTVRLRTSGETGAQPYDILRVTAWLTVPEGGGGFDSGSYYRSRGIYLFATAQGTPAIQTAVSRPPYYYAIRLRQYISGVINRYVYGKWGALASGILIGDVSKLPAGIKSDFTVTGISHILAVSGTQISLIVQYLLLLLAALRIRRRPAACVAAAAVLGFMAVTGFSASVMRAGIMSLVYLGGLLIRREADALNSLGLSVLILCLANPFAAADVGLLLSFSATLGMITVSAGLARHAAGMTRRFPRPVRRLLRPPVGLLCETIGASLLTYPVILLTFRQLSLVTLVSNLLEVPVSLFVTLAAAVLVILAPLRIFGFLIVPVAMLIRFAAAFMIGYAHMLAQLPFATVSASYGFVGIVLLFVFLAALVTWLFRGRGADRRVLAVCIAFTLAVGLLSYTVAAQGVLTAAAMPVTDGGSAVLVMGSHAVVFDLNGSDSDYQVEQYLKSRNVSHVDALILPEYDRNRVDNANGLLASVAVSRIFIPGAYASDENPAAACVSAETVILWQGMQIAVVPDRKALHLLALVSYGSSRLLLTGSGEANPDNFAVDSSALKADVLFCGGDVTAPFEKAVSPTMAVRESAAAVFFPQKCTLRSTDEWGTVRILTRGNGQYVFGSE